MLNRFIFPQRVKPFRKATGCGLVFCALIGVWLVPSQASAQTSAPPSNGLFVWLKADAGVSADPNSGRVSVWADQSSTGNNAYQGNGGNQPTLIPSVLNGKPVVRFDGGASFLDIVDNGSVRPGAITIIAVNRPRATYYAGNSGDLVAHALTRNFYGWLAPYFSYDLGLNNNNVTHGYISGSGGTSNDLAAGVARDQKAQISSLVYNGTTANLFTGGNLQSSVGAAGPINYDDGNRRDLLIGASSGGSGLGRFFNGDIAEVLIYNRGLTTQEQQQAEGYLADKYGTYDVNATWPKTYTSDVQALITANEWNKDQADAYVALVASQPPVATAGLTVWLKADTGVTSDPTTGKVSQWNDQTFLNNNAYQGSVGNQPKFIPSSLNGKPVIRFDGGASFLDITDSTGVRPTTGLTLLAVVKPNATYYAGNSGDILAHSLNRNFYGWIAPYFSYDLSLNNNNVAHGYLSTGGGSSNDFSGGPARDQKAQITSLVYDGANGTLSTSGTVQSTYGVGGTLNYDGTAQRDLLVGASSGGNGLGRFFNGDIAEVLVYNRALTTQEQQQAEGYLADKYGTYDVNATWPKAYTSNVQALIATNTWNKDQADAYVVFAGQQQVATTGLTLWLKADTGVIADPTSGKVSQWNDQTFFNNNASQGNASYQPLLTQDANGKSLIRFNGSYLDIADASSLRPGNQLSILAVVHPNSTSYGDVLSKPLFRNFYGWIAPYYSYDLGFGGGNIIHNYLSTYATSSDLYGNTGHAQQIQLISALYDGATAVVSDNFTVEGTTGVSGGINFDGTSQKDIQIGAANGGGGLTNFFNGDIYEILFYNNHVLSTVEQQQLGVYLANKYGLPSAAPLAIFPPAGNYYQQVQVSILPATSGTPIHYTTDGTTPTTASPLYTGPFTLTAQGATANSITVQAIAGTNSTVVQTTFVLTPSATSPPYISNVQFNGTPLANGGVITGVGTLSASAATLNSISKIEFYIDGTLLGTDTNGADGYTAFLDPSTLTDGTHTLKISAYDQNNARSDLSQSFTVALAAPPAPLIASPTGGVTTHNQVAVSGSAAPNTTITFYVNGQVVTGEGTVTASSNGSFLASVPLIVGQDQIQAIATNRAGASPLSGAATITYDNTLPQATTLLSVLSLPHGQILLNWAASNTGNVAGYKVYRSTSPFTSEGQGTLIATVNGLTFTDSPPSDGTYYYTVVSVGANGLDSPLSSVPSGVSDSVPPTASIQYTALGAYDPTSGRYGVGTVNITVTSSEPLSATPFLTILPPNGLPLPVTLSPGADNLHYVGTVIISSTTPSGLAVASYSALDLAGNRGTQVTSGQNLLIDTAGPQVTQLVATPNGAIQTSASNPTTISFTATLSKALPSGSTPQFGYTLSSTATNPVTISSVTAGADAYTWNISLPLPSTAGQPPETLTLYYQATDDLGNQGTTIVPTHQYQVYQGNLPGLNPPAQLATKSLPGGVIELDWTNVAQAAGYVIYRGTSATDLAPLTQVSTLLTYQDTPAQDGTYYYSVATVRQANSQTSTGAPLDPAVPGVSLRAVPPGPTALASQVVSNGVQLTWTDPVNVTSAITLNLYRSSSAITSLSGLSPLASIPLGKQLVVDPSPTPAQPYYALASVDAAGNLSPFVSTYSNVSLFPVTSLTVTQTDSNPPQLAWSDPTPNLSGYNLFLGPDGALQPLNSSLFTATSYTDTGYSGAQRRYTVIALDAHGTASVPRSLTLEPLTAVLDPNAVILRGEPNQLNYTVTNPTTDTVSNIQLQVTVGGINHISQTFSLNPGASAVVPVVVGGYASLTGTSAPITTTINIVPSAGEKVSLVRSGTVPVAAGQLGLQVLASNFTLGGSGQAQFTLTNPSGVPIQVICAKASGNQPSPDVRFNLLDGNNNIVAQQAIQLTTGNNVTQLATGESVIVVPPGGSVTTPAVNLAVPANLGASVTVQAQIDHIYYDRGQPDEVDLSGLQAQQNVTTTQVPYTGLVTSITPNASNGDQPIVISGIALVTGSSPTSPTPVPNANLNLNISTNGFQRTFPITTDASGNFSYTFTPIAGEPGGEYSVWAINPLLNDTTPQMQFSIRQLQVTPTIANLQSPRNYTQTITLNLASGPASTENNLTLSYNAADQPGGVFAPGLTVTPGAPIAQLVPSQTGTLQATILADSTAPSSGTLYLRVASDENPRWQLVQVNYNIANAVPVLQVGPTSLNVGVSPGQSQPVTQNVAVTNVGLAPLTGARFSLQSTNGANAPAWVSLGSAATLDALAVNATQNVAISFAPDATVAVGDYYFNLIISAQNHPNFTVPIHVAVNNATTSGGQFLIVDAFTPGNITTGFTGGLAGATVTLQNQAIYSSVYSLTTGSDGLASFSNLPVGTYTVQITANQHQTYSTTLTVQPGVQFSQQVVLQYNPVQVTWSVTPTTIQDQYNLVFTTTFDTNVPVPVVTFTPAAINLPQLNTGDVFNVQCTLTNSGLIRADNVVVNLPPDDANIHYELVGTPPTSLEAGQTVTLYYKLTCLQGFGSAVNTTSLFKHSSKEVEFASIAHHPISLHGLLMSLVLGQTASSTSYNSSGGCSYSATCSNGTQFYGSASQTFYYKSAATPQAAQQTTQQYFGGGGGGGGSSGSGGSAPAQAIPAAPTPKCQTTCDIDIGTPPLPKPTDTNGQAVAINRVNPGGVVVLDYNDDDSDGTYDYQDSSKNFEGITPIAKKSGLTEIDLTTSGTDGTLTFSPTTDPNIRIWIADKNGNMHLAQEGELSWTIKSGSYTPTAPTSPQPGGNSLPIKLYAEGIQEGTTKLSLNYSGSDSQGVSDTAMLTVIMFRMISDLNNDGVINDADYKAQLLGASPNATSTQIAAATEYLFDNDQISNGGNSGIWDREDSNAPAGTSTDDDAEEIDLICDAKTATISLDHPASKYFAFYSDSGCTQQVVFPFTITPNNPLPSKLYIRGTGQLPQEMFGNLTASLQTPDNTTLLVQQQLKLDMVKQFGDPNFFPAARAWINKHDSTVFVKDWHPATNSTVTRRICVMLGERTSIRPFETYYSNPTYAGLQAVASANPGASVILNGNQVAFTSGFSESLFNIPIYALYTIANVPLSDLGITNTINMTDHCIGRLVQDGQVSPASLDNYDNFSKTIDPLHYLNTSITLSSLGGDGAVYVSSDISSPGVYFGSGRVPGFNLPSQSVNGPQPYQALGGLTSQSVAKLDSIENGENKINTEPNQIVGDWSDSFGHTAIFTASSPQGLLGYNVNSGAATDFLTAGALSTANEISAELTGNINHYYFLDSGYFAIGLARVNPLGVTKLETGFCGNKVKSGFPYYPDTYLTFISSKPK